MMGVSAEYSQCLTFMQLPFRSVSHLPTLGRAPQAFTPLRRFPLRSYGVKRVLSLPPIFTPSRLPSISQTVRDKSPPLSPRTPPVGTEHFAVFQSG